MPKRSATEKLKRYEKKIRKLLSRKRIRRLDSSSDDEDIENTNDPGTNETVVAEHSSPLEENQSTEMVLKEVATTPLPDPASDSVAAPPSEATPTEPGLDPEILLALGASTSDTPDFGNNVHENLAMLWTPLLKKGLLKDEKDKLLKENLVPANCKLLQAPKLNAEISAAVSDIVRGRDKKFVGFQQQLGNGISGVNRAMDVLLSSDNKIQALKHLSDSCRILSDLHFSLTKDRIKLITPSLEKNFLHMIQESERDDTLFGSSLSEKIKASKAIERQGSQIKKPGPNPKTSGSQSTSTRSNHQGNWSGPPRLPSNRGGRGGYSHRGQRVPPPPPARRPYSTPAPTQSKTYNQPRTRAPHPQ